MKSPTGDSKRENFIALTNELQYIDSNLPETAEEGRELQACNMPQMLKVTVFRCLM